MDEAMNEKNEFEKALHDTNQRIKNLERVECDQEEFVERIATLNTIRKSLEFMAANHEALREGVIEKKAYPELLTDDEVAELLKKAEHLFQDLQGNQLGGYSGINRPFYILNAFMEVIEEFGKRDVGLHWSKDDLAAAKLSQGD